MLALRKEGNWTPVLILTARTGERREADALDSGADDYLSKPFSFVVLLARIRALVRRAPLERPTALTAGDLRLESATHQVSRGEEPVSLTPRQFALLEFLMRRPGEVLAKHTILENVWDFTFDGDPNIVEVYSTSCGCGSTNPLAAMPSRRCAWWATGWIRREAERCGR